MHRLYFHILRSNRLEELINKLQSYLPVDESEDSVKVRETVIEVKI